MLAYVCNIPNILQDREFIHFLSTQVTTKISRCKTAWNGIDCAWRIEDAVRIEVPPVMRSQPYRDGTGFLFMGPLAPRKLKKVDRPRSFKDNQHRGQKLSIHHESQRSPPISCVLKVCQDGWISRSRGRVLRDQAGRPIRLRRRRVHRYWFVPLFRNDCTACSNDLPDSEISTDDEDNIPEEESLAERLLALRDIIPPTTRSYISNKVGVTTSWIKSGLVFSGKTLFVVSTSALFLGVPWALAFAEEQQMVEMEKEMKMREMGGEVCTSA